MFLILGFPVELLGILDLLPHLLKILSLYLQVKHLTPIATDHSPRAFPNREWIRKVFECSTDNRLLNFAHEKR